MIIKSSPFNIVIKCFNERSLKKSMIMCDYKEAYVTYTECSTQLQIDNDAK
jgi:hypothetical protein